MKKIIYYSILTLIIALFAACSDNGEDDSDQNLTNIQSSDSLAQIIQPEELVRGKIIYTNNCQTCHQEDGKGVEGAFPALIEKKADINAIVNGVEGSSMIAFKDELTDQELADIINFINNSWEKSFGRTTIEEITEIK